MKIRSLDLRGVMMCLATACVGVLSGLLCLQLGLRGVWLAVPVPMVIVPVIGRIIYRGGWAREHDAFYIIVGVAWLVALVLVNIGPNIVAGFGW